MTDRIAAKILLIAMSFTTGIPVWADSAAQRETLALRTCLLSYPDAEHQCFDIPFFTCMGTQLPIAANPALAQERCLFQEQFVWSVLRDEACEALLTHLNERNIERDAVCFNNNTPLWSSLLEEIDQARGDRGFSNHSLRVAVQSTRFFAVQLRMLAKAHGIEP